MSSKLQLWSAAVRGRDIKCVHCGAKEDLHAHHIKPKSTHPDLILDLSNGMTLCYRCHKAEHEKNRQPRLSRASKPQRRMLQREIDYLHEELQKRELIIIELQDKLNALKNISLFSRQSYPQAHYK